jgi:hypothetical protein
LRQAKIVTLVSLDPIGKGVLGAELLIRPQRLTVHEGSLIAADDETIAVPTTDRFAASLCDHSPQMLLAVQHSVENGEICELFRTLKRRQSAPEPLRRMRIRASSPSARSKTKRRLLTKSIFSV